MIQVMVGATGASIGLHTFGSVAHSDSMTAYTNNPFISPAMPPLCSRFACTIVPSCSLYPLYTYTIYIYILYIYISGGLGMDFDAAAGEHLFLPPKLHATARASNRP